MIVPKSGKYHMRILKMHQIDAIPSPVDPEKSDGFIVSCFDRTNYMELYQDKPEIDTATGRRGRSVRSSANNETHSSQETADDYQFQRYVERYIVWTPELNFMMDGTGEIIDMETGELATEAIDLESALAPQGIMPFFEISRGKDFEFFSRPSNTLTDFTVQYNSSLSDLQTNIKMNGYSVGVLKAPSELQPENQVVGPAMLLKLPTDDPDKEVDFSFVNPSSNIGEISEANNQLLNYFTTSEGLGADVINADGSTAKYTSGTDKISCNDTET